MSRFFFQTLTRSGERLTSNRAQSAPDYLSLYSDWARPIEGKFQFIRIARLAILLVCVFGTPSACSACQVSADLFETRLAEGIKLLGEGRFLESVEVLNSAKQSAPQDARPYFYCGMALAQAGRMRDAASEVGEAVHLAPEQLPYRVLQAHVFEQLKQASAAQEALAALQDKTLEHLDLAWLRLLADVYYRMQMTDQALKILDLWAQRDATDSRIDLYRGHRPISGPGIRCEGPAGHCPKLFSA